MPGVITSRAIARRASKLSCANPLQTMSRSVTMPISRSFSPIGIAPMSCSRINLASSVTGVSGLTQSTPLCITSLTFMADSVAEVCVSAPVPSALPLYNRLGPQETNGGSVGSSGRRPPREGSGLNSLVHQFTRRRMSADVGDALLGLRLSSGLGMRGKREDRCVLPFIESRQQHDLAIGELKRALIDLAKDRNGVVDTGSKHEGGLILDWLLER